jgi:hypothetical protein
MKDPIRTKQALKIGVEATLTSATELTVTVDSEVGSSAPLLLGELVTWVNNLSNTVVLEKQQQCDNRLVWWRWLYLIQVRCSAMGQVFGYDGHIDWG